MSIGSLFVIFVGQSISLGMTVKLKKWVKSQGLFEVRNFIDTYELFKFNRGM